MGNWTLVIEGTGAHQNGKAVDADRLAMDFINVLVQNGQNVEHATFTCSSRYVLKK